MTAISAILEFGCVLGLQVAGFAAGTAVILAVFAQADFIETLAEPAVFVAGAGPFGQVADGAEIFLGHGERLSRKAAPGNGTMVDGLAGAGKTADNAEGRC
jgi:hypothetical protein